jgi:hypothetical protein
MRVSYYRDDKSISTKCLGMNRVAFPTHTSIVSSRKVAIYTAAVVTIIAIFGLLMTRQILFFNITMEAIILLITVVIAYGVGSWILLVYARYITKELRPKSRFISIMQLAVIIIQFSLFGILLLAIYNELYYGPYSNNTRYFTTSASYPPYIFSWIGTVLLLRHFYQRIGKLPVKHWIILAIPLILYLIGSHQICPTSTTLEFYSERVQLPVAFYLVLHFTS